jgi:hypothetical protein
MLRAVIPRRSACVLGYRRLGHVRGERRPHERSDVVACRQVRLHEAPADGSLAGDDLEQLLRWRRRALVGLVRENTDAAASAGDLLLAAGCDGLDRDVRRRRDEAKPAPRESADETFVLEAGHDPAKRTRRYLRQPRQLGKVRGTVSKQRPIGQLVHRRDPEITQDVVLPAVETTRRETSRGHARSIGRAVSRAAAASLPWRSRSPSWLSSASRRRRGSSRPSG